MGSERGAGTPGSDGGCLGFQGFSAQSQGYEGPGMGLDMALGLGQQVAVILSLGLHKQGLLDISSIVMALLHNNLWYKVHWQTQGSTLTENCSAICTGVAQPLCAPPQHLTTPMAKHAYWKNKHMLLRKPTQECKQSGCSLVHEANIQTILRQPAEGLPHHA